ncbi:MAG: Coenzyme F420 hydrogenase/dehydrogenase, beta subunit C-terminal domain [Promethearchaeota archaeon]
MDAIAEYLINIKDLQKLLSTLLEQKVVNKILGAKLKVDKKSGEIDRFTVTPEVVSDPNGVLDFPLTELLAYGYARTDSAAKYVHKSLSGAKEEKIGLVARPCDTRALIELAKLRQVKLENLFIIAFEDRGIFPKASREFRKIKDVDPSKIVKEKVGDDGLIVQLEDGNIKTLNFTISENCLRCYRKRPVIADLSISDLGIPIESDEIILKAYSEKGNDVVEKSGIQKNPISDELKSAHEAKYKEIIDKAREKRAKDLEEWANLPQEQKIELLKKCTACGTCIRGCPVCYCVDCILIKKRKEKIIDPVSYQLTRIAHDADRCVECGNCNNNCPMNIPLSLYFQSLNDAFKEKFHYEPGMSIEDIPFRSARAIKEMELERF